MGLWSFYFLLKLGLFWSGAIAFNWGLNLALALFLLLPSGRKVKWLKQFIAIPSGVALLYYESYLPPFERVLTQMDQLSQFNMTYLLELAQRFIQLEDVFLLLAAFVIYWLLSLKLRMSSFAVIGILLVPIVNYIGSQQPAPLPTDLTLQQTAATNIPLDPDSQLAEFYREERLRKTSFSPLPPETEPFDIVVLHICSLSWDDLALFQQTKHPFLQRAQITLSAFNTAASYSGPAAIRLMRAGCGQLPHEDLYAPASSQCLMFDQLAASGFNTQLMLNHSGVFGNFLDDIRRLGGSSARLISTDKVTQTMRQFDGDPVYSDIVALKKWMANENPSEPDALYYNSTSLHDGNRLLKKPEMSSTASYPLRLRMLLDDLNGFINALETQGRRTIVVLVPEHGGAIRGDDKQISGLREVPTPAITLAPVSIYFTGLPEKSDSSILDTPVSYLAISELMARFIRDNPFKEDAPPLDSYIADLPRTRFVAENDGIVVIHDGAKYLIRDNTGRWEPLNQ